MNNKVWQPTIYAVLIVVGILIGIWLKPNSGGTFFFSGKSKLNQILSIINQAYVDEVNADSIEETAITNMLEQLDPHSVYIPAKDLQAANEGLEGNFEGVGIEFAILEDSIMVLKSIKEGPANQAGIEAGDRIIAVDSTATCGTKITNDKVFKLLRGASGSKVMVKIFSPQKNALRTVQVVRGILPIYSVEAALMLTSQTGYIKIERFAANTHQEFKEALQKLQQQQVKQLIVDLRNNPGGYLSAATAICDEFLSDKKLLVYTEGRKQSRTEYHAEIEGAFETGKVIILVDEGSASASEIVSGAIQDWDRGVILGRRSFGKGLVQESFELQDKSAIRLTVSRYYTPSGRCIQKNYTDGISAYEHEISNRFSAGEVSDASKQQVNDSTAYKTAKNRTVFGGGGITPDVFVPIDTAYMNDFYMAAFEAQALNKFCFRYLDAHRKNLLSKYKDAGVYNAMFTVTPAMWTNLVDVILKSSQTNFSTQQINEARQQLQLLCKANIARQVWGDEGYYTVLNSQDELIKKALQVFATDYGKILKE